ncbi:DUF998 domain-containing protein [Sphingomonas sp. dw_22]|uniref:DUF998 domain-containing protein n=1 Tax=Sphingomonas sp. dw_22 TaxID=2721175 RepID=UPI001BD629D0|nr:DUF998 domain-containing protein [Sphingomonas sp. dw_22]
MRAGNLLLLICGLAASIVYVGTDLVAASRYPGYSFTDQAVSELFAIGAPTRFLVVPLFSIASLLLLAFAWGVWLSAGGSPMLRLVAVMSAASAVDALILWNAFPMHMRGAERTFTDTMHLILGANPFVWLALIFGATAFRGRFRTASIATLILLVLPAVFAFRYVHALDMGEATPGLGLAERVSQYGYQLWQAALALLLINKTGTPLSRNAG